MARNRIIYQSESLFVGPTTQDGDNVAQQIHRVQDISHDLDVNRTDIFEFGQLAPITRQVIEPPTVSLDFSYYLADAAAERRIGLHVSGTRDNSPANAISGILDDDSKREKNYYVVTVPEHLDAHGDPDPTSNIVTVVGFGNGAISNYTVNAAVGDLPTASVTIEAYNMAFVNAAKAPDGLYNAWLSGQAPSVNKENNTLASDQFLIPSGGEGCLEVFAVRPGDIEIVFGTGSQESHSPQIGGAILPSGDPDSAADIAGQTPMHIQNFSIEVPLARTPLQRVGSTFPYDRAIDFPLDMTFNCSALLADIQTGTLLDLMCNDQDKRDITVNCKFPCGREGLGGSDKNIVYTIKNAYLQSQNFSNSIGDNKTVDFSWTAQFGGINDTSNGLFISGANGNYGVSTLSAAATAGTSSISVVCQDGFEIGDTVEIGKGSPAAEKLAITSFGSLNLNGTLSNSHDAGTSVHGSAPTTSAPGTTTTTTTTTAAPTTTTTTTTTAAPTTTTTTTTTAAPTTTTTTTTSTTTTSTTTTTTSTTSTTTTSTTTTTTAAPLQACVSNAGSVGHAAANGTYTEAGTYNGKAYYEIDGGGYYIYWNSVGDGIWYISSSLGSGFIDEGPTGGSATNPWDGVWDIISVSEGSC